MEIKLTVKNLENVTKLFDSMKKNIKPEVIDKSLDKILAEDLAKLKLKLLNTINNEIKSKVTVQKDDGNVEDIKVKKSDQEMVKHLTGVDLDKLTKTKDFNTLADGKVAIVSNKTLQKATIDRMNGGPTSKMSSGVNLRLPMSDSDTFDNQYAQAVDYYNKAIFVFVDNNGRANYYQNPGIDMTPYIKVVCSKETGPTDKSKARWDKHRDKRGYADWTLLNDGLERVKKDFINLTDVLDKMKDGDYDEARGVLNKVSQKASSVGNISDKLNDLKDNKKLDTSVEAYNNIVKLLRNLQLQKTVRKDRTYYTLISNYDENMQDYQKFQERLKQEVKLWKITNEQRWVDTLLKSILKLAQKLLR